MRVLKQSLLALSLLVPASVYAGPSKGRGAKPAPAAPAPDPAKTPAATPPATPPPATPPAPAPAPEGTPTPAPAATTDDKKPDDKKPPEKKPGKGELEELLNRHSVPNGKIYTAPDMLDDPHFAAREAIVRLACGPRVRPQIVGRDQLAGALKPRSVVVAFPNGSATVERTT